MTEANLMKSKKIPRSKRPKYDLLAGFLLCMQRFVSMCKLEVISNILIPASRSSSAAEAGILWGLQGQAFFAGPVQAGWNCPELCGHRPNVPRTNK